MVILSFNVYSQERQDEARQKLDFKLELKSDKITRITGWSRIETSDGKVWEQSKPSMGYNYLVGRPQEYSFYSLQVVEFSIKGEKFYTLSVWRPRFKQYEDFIGTKWEYDSLIVTGSDVDWFFFSESSLKRLKNVVNAADGNSYLLTDVKYYKTGSANQGGDNQGIYIDDKELKNILETGNLSILKMTNLCKGDSLFNINSQVLKGDTIVRLNLLSDIYPGSDNEFRLLPLEDSYFELSKHEFNRLFKFSPFVSKEKSQRAREYFRSGNEKNKLKDYNGAIADYSKAIEIDPDYADAYCARGLSEIEAGQKAGGCMDLKKAAALGYKNANKKIKEYCQ
jgi:tetratricopeptide (TPR) repeat protein